MGRRGETRVAAACIAATTVALLWLAMAAQAHRIPNPSANRAISPATNQACFTAPTSQTCANDALADINAARASEGVVPMVLPRDWGSLTIPQQLLVLTNLERVDRGLAPIPGLAKPLDSDAQAGANGDRDPTPTHFYGNVTGSNWEGGYVSPLLSDFSWMYHDGPNGGNRDCTSTKRSGCWIHRGNILRNYSKPVAMGAAYAPSTPDGPSEAELFVGGDRKAGAKHPDAPIAPAWAKIASTLPIGVSAQALTLSSGGTRAAELELWASGEAMNVTAAITSGASAWTVSPTACRLKAGRGCTLKITAAGGATGPGTLTLTGPNGRQTVALTAT